MSLRSLICVTVLEPKVLTIFVKEIIVHIDSGVCVPVNFITAPTQICLKILTLDNTCGDTEYVFVLSSGYCVCSGDYSSDCYSLRGEYTRAFQSRAVDLIKDRAENLVFLLRSVFDKCVNNTTKDRAKCEKETIALKDQVLGVGVICRALS